GPRVNADRGSIPNVLQGIDDLAVLQDFEMHMRSGRAAAGTHVRHGLAFLHHVTDAYQVVLVVRITGDEPVAVIDLDHVPVTVTAPGVSHDARRHCDHVGAFGTGEIQAVMARTLA